MNYALRRVIISPNLRLKKNHVGQGTIALMAGSVY